MSDWIVLGSGPSAGRWPIPSNLPVATCNASVNLIDGPPDYWGCFELHPGCRLKSELANAAGKGFTKVCMRLHNATRAGLSEQDGIMIVPKYWGPAELRDLHDDIQWAEEDGTPEYGERTAWISSGVLMMWLIAELERPRRIYVVGLDGYPDEPDNSKDYATGLPILAHDGLDSFNGRERRRQMNKRMSEGIGRITTFYSPLTEFIWLEEPNHLREDWCIRVADSKDLKRLYGGYVQT